MKSSWLILTTPEMYQKVLEELKKQKIQITNQLEGIFVISVLMSSKKVAQIKMIEGVMAVEPDGEVSVQ